MTFTVIIQGPDTPERNRIRKVLDYVLKTPAEWEAGDAPQSVCDETNKVVTQEYPWTVLETITANTPLLTLFKYAVNAKWRNPTKQDWAAFNGAPPDAQFAEVLNATLIIGENQDDPDCPVPQCTFIFEDDDYGLQELVLSMKVRQC